jgi:CBS domain-containing protein
VAVVTQSLRAFTAGELMSADVITISATLPVRNASECLAAARVSGAPVVDESGRCVGVFSVTDIARWATKPPAAPAGASRTCSHWGYRRDAAGEQVSVCKLDVGACALQRPRFGPDCDVLNVCSQPHGVCIGEWQVLEPAETSVGTVGEYMTPDPVTAAVDAPMQKLARMMIDASVHRVIVVDDAGRPVGIVTSTDVLAAVARGWADIGGGNDHPDFGKPDIYCGG